MGRKQWKCRLVWISFCLFLMLSVVPGRHTEAAVKGSCGNHAKWKYDEGSRILTIFGKGAVTLNRREEGSLGGPEDNIRVKKLIVKEGITSITFYNNNHTFQYNEFKLDQVSLPDSLRSIRGPLFMNCKISTLTIPKKVKHLDAIPFLFANIKELKVHKQNKYFTVSKEGILFSKNRKTLLYYPRNCKMKKYEVPKSVTKIGQMAFYGNDSLENIVFTKKIKTIGNGAFAYCHHLKKTNIQITKVKEIQDYNGKTYGLQRFFGFWYYPESEIDEYGLDNNICGYYDYSLKKYVNAENMNYFGTFQGSVLSSFVMPNSMKYMGKQTLYPNYNYRLAPKNHKQMALKKLVIGKNFMGEINGGKSGSNHRTRTLDLHFVWERGTVFKMKTIQVHKKNKKYRVKAQVLYNKNMDTIYLAATTTSSNLIISDKVHYIARGAFYLNHNVKSVRFLGKILQIHDSAFEDCGKLKKVELPRDGIVERIGKSAFYYCRNMTFTSGKIRYLDHNAFAVTDCVDFDTCELSYIGNCALYGCNIKTLKIDGPLEYIGKKAFLSCDLLTEINIHSNKALFIDDNAFVNCHKIDTASFTSDVSVTLGDEILMGCGSFRKVILSNGTIIPEGGFNKYYDAEIVWV